MVNEMIFNKQITPQVKDVTTLELSMDTIHVDGGISVFVPSHDGSMAAIGIEDMLGVYLVQPSGSMKHLVSFTTSNSSSTVSNVAFHVSDCSLLIGAENGSTVEVPIDKSQRGRFAVVEV